VPEKVRPPFFIRFGFAAARWEELANALRRHAFDNEIVLEERSAFGTRYVIDGILQSPDGRSLNVRTAWFIYKEGGAPRFITAHPLRRRRL
jgi:hypothetical protein